MAQFMLLLHESPTDFSSFSPDEIQSVIGEYTAWRLGLQAEGKLAGGLKLADEALREMDGYLTAKNKATLRPGSEKRYIAYIARLHYKRWLQTLRDMPKMPGPFGPR